MTRTLLALLILATPASAMTRLEADGYCSRQALNALPPPSYFYVRNEAQLAGAEIGDALGRMIILTSVKSSCLRKLGFAPKRKPAHELKSTK